jgi:hypothetical protein
MELENLKTVWKEQDRLLNENVRLNERILKNTFTQHANGVIENLLRWEYFSLIEFAVFLVFMGIATFRSMHDWRFLISGAFITAFLASCMAVGIQSIRILTSIDLFSQSIVETKQAILRFKRRSNNLILALLFAVPPAVITFLLLGVSFVRGINLLDFPVFFAVLSSGIIVMGYVIVFIFHRTFYLRKFTSIENSLAELEGFTSER